MNTLRSTEQTQYRQHVDYLLVPFEFEGYGLFETIRPKQVIDELRQLYDLVKDLKPKRVVEIGTFRGGTFYLWCQAADDNATLIALDLPGQNSLDQAFTKPRQAFYDHFKKAPTQTLHFVEGDSHQPATAGVVQQLLEDDPIDFLFIDGDHSYDGVVADFELFRPMVRSGGVIAFHDILPRENHPEIAVYRLWEKLKEEYKHQTFIAQQGQYANFVGIGVIWV